MSLVFLQKLKIEVHKNFSKIVREEDEKDSYNIAFQQLCYAISCRKNTLISLILECTALSEIREKRAKYIGDEILVNMKSLEYFELHIA